MKASYICSLLLALVISVAFAIPAPLKAAYAPQNVRQNAQSQVESVGKVDVKRGEYYYYYETPTYYYYESPTYYYYESPTYYYETPTYYYYYETPTYYYYESPTYYYYESPTYYYYESPTYYYYYETPTYYYYESPTYYYYESPTYYYDYYSRQQQSNVNAENVESSS